jgi:ABC-type sugar transport system ATPase subunit
MHLHLQHISKSFGNEQVLLDINLKLPPGKTQSILGPSGCGKTTLLKIIAGLIDADGGEIFVKDSSITSQPANQRNMVYLNQEPLLFPHLNVFENIAFGLRIRKDQQAEINRKVSALASRLGLSEQLKKFPHQLSGGQKQRVSFGRGIIINPPVLLLDEPFASLDAENRTSMQQLFKQVSKEIFITSLFVTHDLKEAILMADEIALLKNGTLICYESVESFVNDPSSGVQKEISFWKSLS